MNNKKKTIRNYIILSLGLVAVISTAIGANIFDGTSQALVNNTTTPNTSVQTVSAEGMLKHTETIAKKYEGKIDATYGDGVNNLQELKEKAQFIVRGKVIQQENNNAMTVTNLIKVTKAYKNEVLKEIKVLQVGQIGGEEVLEKDSEYILFLNPQEGRVNEYYVVGANVQGQFKHDQNGNSLDNHDLKLLKEIQNKSLNDGTSELSAMENFIAN
ncbi:hypothetical protein SY83_05625 [Paenibacillus swuensis]|uniref:Uncharacterized protein n=1 Tax=Paenibacillus swuensis TaxID=1178515 RepID=A0A172TFT7_9BACL|nr:hypothetical protein [Paenibacillus swuensis]ANE45870.1 hypothetical protein SY83_05625 [Paenibacillus swuensis]